MSPMEVLRQVWQAQLLWIAIMQRQLVLRVLRN
jgi:hypothetical protein